MSPQMTSTATSTEARQYEAHAWCDRTFTARFIVTADSPQTALAVAKQQVDDENAEECDNGYPWDTFTIETMDGAVVASEEPSKVPPAFTESVLELLAHIEDLASEFSIWREISQRSYVTAIQSASTAQAGAA
jgi:hypothetical protein